MKMDLKMMIVENGEILGQKKDEILWMEMVDKYEQVTLRMFIDIKEQHRTVYQQQELE